MKLKVDNEVAFPFIAVYESPAACKRAGLWTSLHDLSTSIREPWLVEG